MTARSARVLLPDGPVRTGTGGRRWFRLSEVGPTLDSPDGTAPSGEAERREAEGLGRQAPDDGFPSAPRREP